MDYVHSKWVLKSFFKRVWQMSGWQMYASQRGWRCSSPFMRDVALWFMPSGMASWMQFLEIYRVLRLISIPQQGRFHKCSQILQWKIFAVHGSSLQSMEVLKSGPYLFRQGKILFQGAPEKRRSCSSTLDLGKSCRASPFSEKSSQGARGPSIVFGKMNIRFFWSCNSLLSIFTCTWQSIIDDMNCWLQM